MRGVGRSRGSRNTSHREPLSGGHPLTTAPAGFALIIIGIAIGALVVYAWMRVHVARLQTQADERRDRIATLQRELESARGDATRVTGELAVVHARGTERAESAVAANLEHLRTAVESLRAASAQERSALQTQMENLAHVHRELRSAVHSAEMATTELKSALANTAVRASWGEFSLRRVIELAGMAEHCDFETQRTFATEAGGARPDVVVHMAGGRCIPIDAKTPYTDYLASTQTAEPAEQRRLLMQSAQALRQRVKDLAARPYDRINGYAGFVILFVPLESFLSAAAAADQTLLEDSARQRIYLASPTLLLCYLQAFAHGWQLQRQAENAEHIADAGRRLYESVSAFALKLQSLGGDLGRVVSRYNEAVGTYVARVSPRARRIAQLAALKTPTAEPAPLESEPELSRLMALVQSDAPQLPLADEAGDELLEESAPDEREVATGS